MTDGPGVAAADGAEGLPTVAAQLVARDRVVIGIDPAEPHLPIAGGGGETGRRGRRHPDWRGNHSGRFTTTRCVPCTQLECILDIVLLVDDCYFIALSSLVAEEAQR